VGSKARKGGENLGQSKSQKEKNRRFQRRPTRQKEGGNSQNKKETVLARKTPLGREVGSVGHGCLDVPASTSQKLGGRESRWKKRGRTSSRKCKTQPTVIRETQAEGEGDLSFR